MRNLQKNIVKVTFYILYNKAKLFGIVTIKMYIIRKGKM